MNLQVNHFTTYLAGGAGIAAHRLHKALCRTNTESRLFFNMGESSDPTIIAAFQNRRFLWRNAVDLAISWRNRQTVPGGFVTAPGWIRKTPIQATGMMPDIVNLHWVARWLDLPSFFGSLPDRHPVVWSVHDLIPITGGCHYPGECDHFTQRCGNCPQQRSPRETDATRKFFRIKEKIYAGKNLHFVGNSEWTSAQVRRSGLAKYAQSVRTIPLGVDVGQFQPVEKIHARRAMGILDDRLVIGFACADLSEERKGAGLLIEAAKVLAGQKVLLVTFGSGRWPEIGGIETLQLGALHSPRLQSLYYSALDVFVTPSRVETFGNTAMEAMACETPVVAYATSGLNDVVADGETGLLEQEIGSVPGLVRMRQHPGERQKMGVAARQRVIRNFSDALMAERYTTLYEELLNSRSA